ncbi:phage tail tape measure protein [Nitratireductor aquimarinus]|uniref:phage tail tape measure protein n=1 Tax=Nitratireductor TaxID=245876 RepID=UPI0019D3D0BB|nr:MULTISPECIES: phage tail tape measure protein [Nitratireductor]MBN7777781.1 phage tail tape measure protein [Nitratireductor pacificus]MBN7781775.1 phage tail tape measure protein [Nitratireductor pacificus]MBN7790581.1 phage tail tape measure protein [Nitratireductor aquimarinus]MBY6099991.1 phage tail tape measure protein [Nitratireductor aquimarinus]MCA1260455.1 phage tail tape measure protein [Nitratireductor aquimarinus]
MAQGVIGSLRVNLGIDTAAFSKGLKSAESGLQRFGKLAKTGLLAAGAAAAAAAGGLAVMVKGTINSADEMAKASRSFGVPIEELSRLKYAADLSGVSFSNLGNALRTLNKNAFDASNGTGAAKDAFSELGVSVENADGSLKSATQLMGEVADALKNVDDETRKAALSGKIFGERYGPQLASLLAGGSEGINKLTSEADQFGQVFTEKMGASAEAFNDNLSRLSGAFGALAADVAERLLPYLERFTNWLVENSPAIAQFASDTVEGFAWLIEKIGQVIQWFDDLDASIRRFGDDLRANISVVQEFAAELLSAFTALPGQMYQIGLDIVQGLWNGLKAQWETVKSSVTGFASDVAGSFRSVLGIKSPSRVMYEIGVNIMEGLHNGMTSMSDGVKGIASSAADGITGSFEGIGTGIAEAIKGTKEWKDVALDAIRSVATSILSNMNFGGGIFGGLLKGLLGGLVGFANGGSFRVGGSGGIDSQMVAFKASPNETVDIRKPGQDAGGGVGYAPTYNIDARGADQAAIARLERGLAEMDRNFNRRVDARTNTRDVRGTRP